MSRASRKTADRKPETLRGAHPSNEPSPPAASPPDQQNESDNGPGASDEPGETAHRLLHPRHRVDDLIRRIHESTDKLAGDDPSRGDLKILARTIREPCYAFKVFPTKGNRLAV